MFCNPSSTTEYMTTQDRVKHILPPFYSSMPVFGRRRGTWSQYPRRAHSRYPKWVTMKALLLAAVALLAPTPPFPPPKLVGATPEMKCDWGAIHELKLDRGELVMRTDAGPLTLELGPHVKLAGPDGKPLASIGELRSGVHVRAYYVVEKTAKAREIDVIER